MRRTVASASSAMRSTSTATSIATRPRVRSRKSRPTSGELSRTSSGCWPTSLAQPVDGPKYRHGMRKCRHYVLSAPLSETHNVGMSSHSADISGQLQQSDRLKRLQKAQLGAFFRPRQMEEAGLTREQLRTLIRKGEVERIGRGLYRLAEAETTENYSLAMVCARVPNSIVCLLSALRVHGIGTQAPAAVWLAIPHKARVPRLPEIKLRIVRFSGPAWTFGVKDTTFEGVPAKITTPARTVADCFRFERLVGLEAHSKRVSAANEPRERSEPSKRRASKRVGESEGRSPSVNV